MDSQVVAHAELWSGPDSQVLVGHYLDVVDKAWKEDKIPKEDIAVPVAELPDPDSEFGDPHLTLKKQEERWNDVGLDVLRDEESQPALN